MRFKGTGVGSPTLGKYQVIASLGRGGMAQVFLALSRGLGGFSKLVVIKLLDSDEKRFRDMFLDEARIAARLNHPNVIDTYEVAEDAGSYFIAMEYLDGQPLNKIVRHMRDSQRKLDPRICARILADALAGLHYAHDLSDYDGTPLHFVHRDVSPHNLFVTYDGQVKVFDFGVAKAESQLALTTQVGVLKGKIAYMAPEQAVGQDVDRRADIFAAGLVFWELLTLERLMARESTIATLRRLLDEPVPPLSEALPGAPAALEAILKKALARDPADRYQTAQQMRDALLEFLVSEGRECTQDELAELMKLEFEQAHRDLQARIGRCIRAAGGEKDVRRAQDVTTAETAGIGSVVPVLDSGRYGLDDGLDATEPGSRSARAKVTRTVALAPEPSPSRPPERRRTLWLAALVIAAAALLLIVSTSRRAGPIVQEAAAVRPAPAAESSVVLRLHGSNTIGLELAPALAEAFLRQKGLEQVSRRPGQRAHETLIRAASPDHGPAQVIEIAAEGSATAFSDLATGSCDVGMSSRLIKPDEADELKSKGYGDLRTPAGEHVLGLDGIAVIVHPNNPLYSFDLAQLRKLFNGEITDFSEAGGPEGPVHVYARDDQSGTFDTFKHLVLGESPLAPRAKRLVDSESLSDAVAGDPQGIGFIGIIYVRNAKALAVGEPGSARLFPSTFTVATEDYALSRRLYLYVPTNTKNQVAMDFVNFALSADGQKIVKQTGFIDLTVGVMSTTNTCDNHCPRRYLELTRNARRLSLDFRFRSGSADLDSRAMRDIDRLLLFLRQLTSPRLLLLGFSDSRGSSAQNLALSHERVKKVDEELAARGVHAARVDAIGPEMPVASNDNDTGREKNRRVEVWLEGSGL